jgi:hypothetical protein
MNWSLVELVSDSSIPQRIRETEDVVEIIGIKAFEKSEQAQVVGFSFRQF